MLSYAGAFTLSALVATLGAFIGFLILMDLPTSSVSLFFGMVVLAPMIAALVAFGLFLRIFSGRWLSLRDWLIAAGAIVVVSLGCFVLVVSNTLEELPATVLMMGMLYVGGRIGLQRTHLA